MSTIKFSLQNSVGLLTLSRPESLNALNKQVISDLAEVLAQLENSKELRCLVLTGEGKAFVAGADIKEMQNYSSDEAKEMALNGQKTLQMLENLSCPTIAAVNGFALGGGLELALACDFILASEKAKLGLPEVSLGLIPGFGGTQRLSRVVGRALAKMMIFTGDIYSADDCYKWGLVAKVFPADGFMDSVMAVAGQISQRSPKALALAKNAIQKGYDQTLQEGLLTEADLFAQTFKTKDHDEGIQAFIEKRKPEFLGL